MSRRSARIAHLARGPLSRPPGDTRTRLPGTAHPAPNPPLPTHPAPNPNPPPPTHPAPNPNPPPPTTCSRSQRKRWRSDLVSYMTSHLERFVSLIASPTKEAAQALSSDLIGFFSGSHDLPPPVEPSSAVAWTLGVIGDPKQHPSDVAVPGALLEAARMRQRGTGKQRTVKRRLVSAVLLHKDPSRIDAFSRTIPTFWVDPLPRKNENPPRGHWIAESIEQYSIWNRYFDNAERPDARKARQPVHLVDFPSLQLIIPAELGCHIKDRRTGELIFSVKREFCPDPAVLGWASSVVEGAVTTRKSIRLEDTGAIIQVGFSAGSRSRPSFGFVRNLLSKDTDADADNRQFSALLTFFWLCAMGTFAQEIIDDLKNFYREFDIPRLDPDWPSSGDTCGALELPPACGSYTFADVEIAPGCAVVAQRYARAVHREIQGHDWALTWNIMREGTNVSGGNFYLCNYGISIMQSTNCAFAWKPAQYHTTSLASFEPTFDTPDLESLEFNQRGIAFVTSPRIRSAYAAWKEKAGLTGRERVEGLIAELAAPSAGDEAYD